MSVEDANRAPREVSRPTKRERTRSLLLDVALDLFVTHGFESTTMAAIADKAGVVRQTVLNHYPRKEAFVVAWGQRRRDQLDVFTADTGESPIAALDRIYDELATINEAERELTAALHPIYELVVGERPVPAAVSTTLRRAHAAGLLDAHTSPEMAAEVLTAIYFDTLSRWLRHPHVRLAPELHARIHLATHGILHHDT